MTAIYICLIFINSFAFLIYGIDKWLAISQKRRVPEKLLLSAALIGGSLGAVLGMIVFRHKVSKTSFLVKFLFVVGIQIGLYFLIFEKYKI